jgi:hypothetical protein
MRPINELRMKARWKLGGALAKVERAPEGGDRRTTGKQVTSGFWRWTKEVLALSKPIAVEAQRIGTMPDEELAKLYEQARKEARLLHYGEMIAGSSSEGRSIFPGRAPSLAWRVVRSFARGRYP